MAKIISTSQLSTTEVTITPATKLILLNIAGNLSTDGVNLDTLYSYLKQQWKTDSELIKYPFPMVAITVEAFELVSGWDFADQSTKDLIRDGGWALKAAGTGVLEESYMNLTSLGNFDNPSVDKAYYLQVDAGVPTEVVLTGPVNQAIKIYGDAGHGTVDYRTFFKIYLREQGKTYGFYDLISDQNLTSLEAKKYALPLSNGTDLKITAADVAIDAVVTEAIGASDDITFTSPSTITSSGVSLSSFVSGDLILVQGSTSNDGYYTVTGTPSATTLVVTEATITTAGAIGDTVTVTAKVVPDVAPYNAMTLTYLNGVGFTTYATAQPYPANTVVLDSNIQSNSSTLGTWWITPGGGTSNGANTGVDTGITDWVSYTGERQIGLEWYAYNKIINGNNATAEQIYEFAQFELRQAIDIDRGLGDVRGNTATELGGFIGDTLKTASGVYIDNFQPADTNRLQFVDYFGITQTYPYVAAGSLLFNDNLTGDADAIYRVFFTSVSGGDYGTTNAITINDASGPTPIAGNVSAHTNGAIGFDYDYQNNTQGGRTPNTDAAYTAVAVGLSLAQFVVTTGSIVKSTANSINFVAALERNYIA